MTPLTCTIICRYRNCLPAAWYTCNLCKLDFSHISNSTIIYVKLTWYDKWQLYYRVLRRSIKFGKCGSCLKMNALMWRWGTLGRSSVPIATRKREYVCSITCFEMLMKGSVTSVWIYFVCDRAGDCFAILLAKNDLFFQLRTVPKAQFGNDRMFVGGFSLLLQRYDPAEFTSPYLKKIISPT